MRIVPHNNVMPITAALSRHEQIVVPAHHGVGKGMSLVAAAELDTMRDAIAR
jgi:hypothetical protein